MSLIPVEHGVCQLGQIVRKESGGGGTSNPESVKTSDTRDLGAPHCSFPCNLQKEQTYVSFYCPGPSLSFLTTYCAQLIHPQLDMSETFLGGVSCPFSHKTNPDLQLAGYFLRTSRFTKFC